MISAIINGPPGSGKTTICNLLQEKFGIIHLSTGALLRDNIKNKTKLGIKAKEYITAKKIIPDNIIIEMISERLHEMDDKQNGYILDGFPRTVDQALALNRKNLEIQQFILLDLPFEKIENRILGRRIDPITAKIYHQPMKIPANKQIRQRIIKKSDDTLINLRARLEAYKTFSPSTYSIYEDKILKINVNRKLNDIMDDVFQYLQCESPIDNKIDNNEAEKVSNLMEQGYEDLKPNDSLSSIKNNLQTISIEEVAKESESDNESNNLSNNSMFRDRLGRGINIVKHGRRGNPHQRIVFADANMTRIYWQKNGSKELKGKIDHSIAINEVTDVFTGRETEVMKRSGNDKHANRYVCLKAGNRTLDMEASSVDEAEFLIDGFRQLIHNV